MKEFQTQRQAVGFALAAFKSDAIHLAEIDHSDVAVIGGVIGGRLQLRRNDRRCWRADRPACRPSP